MPDQPIVRRGKAGHFWDKGLEGASHHAVIPNVNTVGDLPAIWPRLSADERRLFVLIARSYLAALMPDFRYRQTTATLDVGGALFRAIGRQPIELGWKAAFGPEDEAEGEEGGQLLPPLRDGEAARLTEPKVEAKETKPPPRYSEGTLVEAMQNAWRFVEDPALRERLKEAKGIGTPATRAEIIKGLKRQDFLAAQGKLIVPTERGLALFGVLERADPALVDPGVTARLEFLLDEVLVGKQEAEAAIDAVCDQAARIIGRLVESGAATALPGDAAAGATCPAPFRRPAPPGRPARRCGSTSKTWPRAWGSSRRPATRSRPRPAAASSTGMRRSGPVPRAPAMVRHAGRAPRSGSSRSGSRRSGASRSRRRPRRASGASPPGSTRTGARPAGGPPKVIAGPGKPVASRGLPRGPRTGRELLLPRRWARR